MNHKTLIRKMTARIALVLLLCLSLAHVEVYGQDQVVIAGDIQIEEV